MIYPLCEYLILPSSSWNFLRLALLHPYIAKDVDQKFCCCKHECSQVLPSSSSHVLRQEPFDKLAVKSSPT